MHLLLSLVKFMNEGIEWWGFGPCRTCLTPRRTFWFSVPVKKAYPSLGLVLYNELMNSKYPPTTTDSSFETGKGYSTLTCDHPYEQFTTVHPSSLPSLLNAMVALSPTVPKKWKVSNELRMGFHSMCTLQHTESFLPLSGCRLYNRSNNQHLWRLIVLPWYKQLSIYCRGKTRQSKLYESRLRRYSWFVCSRESRESTVQ